MRRVPMVDLRAQHTSIREEIREAIDRVIEAQHFILGEEVERFEAELGAYVGAEHVVGVSSGTDALVASLMALDVGPGDEVITSALSFVATASAIVRVGATPVFVDLEAGEFAIDAENAERALGPRTRAIVPVHLFGAIADPRPLLRVAATRHLPILADAAQAIGATRDARGLAQCASLAALSFFPTKNLGAYGDAGAVVTSNDDLAASLRRIRAHGQVERHFAATIGGNFRIDALQAAVLRVKLRHLDAWTNARRAHGARYDEAFRGRGLDGRLALPTLTEGHVCHQYVVRTQERDALRAHLADEGIATEIYYPTPIHRQPAFARFAPREGNLPNAECAARESLSLPVHAELSEGDQARVIDAVRGFFARR